MRPTPHVQITSILQRFQTANLRLNALDTALSAAGKFDREAETLWYEALRETAAALNQIAVITCYEEE